MRRISPFTTLCGICSVGIYYAIGKEANGELPEEIDTCWRGADLNAGHDPSLLGWNPEHDCLAHLCHICERVPLHKLQLKNTLVHMCLTRIPCLSVFFLCRHTHYANHSCKLPAYTNQIGYFLSLKFLYQMQTCSHIKKCVGNRKV